jgi:hypothetical protein
MSRYRNWLCGVMVVQKSKAQAGIGVGSGRYRLQPSVIKKIVCSDRIIGLELKAKSVSMRAIRKSTSRGLLKKKKKESFYLHFKGFYTKILMMVPVRFRSCS